MRLIVGLGNPDSSYQNTRHNIGFMAIDAFAKNIGVTITQNKFSGLYTQTTYQGEKIILLKPQKYMNLSGEVINDYVHYFKIEVSDILIISDDLDLPIGTIKLKYKGSSGGHNGLKDIENHLHTNVYKRLKIGISHNRELDTKEYVLGKFSGTDKKEIEELMTSIPYILKDYMDLSFENVMNKYNKKQDTN